MSFHLDEIVPWGRSFEEYVRMFALDDHDLAGPILGCGDGPASFNAGLHRRGGRAISIDPIYAFSRAEIEARIAATRPRVMEQLRAHRQDFVWRMIPSPEALERLRLEAMATFLEDFEDGRAEGRYRAGELPALPFPDDHFALALSSHFLFLYDTRLTPAFHREAVAAMLRVAREVRIFPLVGLDGRPSPQVEPVMEHGLAQGCEVAIVPVAYEVQRGGDAMLRIRRPAPSVHPLRDDRLGEHPAAAEIETLVADFSAQRLPLHRWTHRAHLAVGLWYVRRFGEAAALDRLRQLIPAHNRAAGIPDGETSGYHETLTRLYLQAIAGHHAAHPDASVEDSLALLLRSPLADRDWPLRFYAPEELRSAAARLTWHEPTRDGTSSFR